MYYPKFKSFQILIPLLKAHGISHIVISPGSRMREFVLAVEEDPYFTCYSVVDERSASYFAIGLSQELNVPVVITCTSSTATTNYYPGLTEAFYQNVPIVAITGDRDPYLLGQQEDQMIDQVDMYDKIMKKSVNLPIINNDSDFWYCERLINEAILEIDHRGKGPIHINIPVPAVITWKDEIVTSYPQGKVIKRISLEEYDKNVLLKEKLEELKSANRILVLAGQNVDAFNTEILRKFFNKYNCVIHAEHMGNLDIDCRMNLAMLGEGFNEFDFDEFLPDFVITFHGTLGVTRNIKEILRKKNFEHWHICESGKPLNAYKNLTTIFECTPISFFEYFVTNANPNQSNNERYYKLWFEKYKSMSYPNIPFSNVYVIQKFLEIMPEGCLLHLSILNSIRISHFFELPPQTKVYANIGTDGIDGCMSTFLGQSYVKDGLSFLIIGDLSFFYDMNSLRIKHIKNNVRILLINNHGGNEFYQQPIMPTTDQGLGAKHNNSAQGWAKSVGFKYLFAQNKIDYINQLDQLMSATSKDPILFEVFTDTFTDRETVFSLKRSVKTLFDKKAAMKQKVNKVIGESNANKIKGLFGKIGINI